MIFYDSDWNPAMDAQAQDRAHRIGQTKQVHIYRLVSEKTVEENILKKALQKRQLEQLTLQEGEFSPAALAAMAAAKNVDVRELLGEDGPSMALDDKTWREATRAAEDGADVEAAERALQEEEQQAQPDEFKEELDIRIEKALDPLQRFGFKLMSNQQSAIEFTPPPTRPPSGVLTYDATVARPEKQVYKPN